LGTLARDCCFLGPHTKRLTNIAVRLKKRRGVSKLFCALTLVACSLTPVAARAITSPKACPNAAFWISQPLRPDQAQSELERLASFADACDAREDFHAQRGALLFQLRRHQEAAIALERALLINPELAGAQIDYALTLGALGQRDEAIDLLGQVAKRPDIEASLRSWLQGEIALAAQREPSKPAKARPSGLLDALSDASRLSGLVQTGFGRETNLTGATHSRELTLYLNNGPVLVPLSETQLPISGHTQRSLAALQATTKMGTTEIQLGGIVQSRRTLHESIPTQQFSRLEINANFPIEGRRLQLGASQQDLEQGSLYAAKDRKYGLTYLLDEQRAGCKPQVNFSVSELSYPLTPLMDGRYRVIRLESQCPVMGELRLGASIGLDDPKQPERPGGARRGWDVYARHLAPLDIRAPLASVKVLSWVRFARTVERGIFSELLAQSPADTRRVDAGIGLWLPFNRQWEIGAELETNSQQSSNPLLNLKNRGLYLVLRWQFA